jgi:translation initiation factor 1
MVMSKKKINSSGRLVYSTDPDFKLPEDNFEEEQTPEPAQQQLSIRLDTKHRAGKAVTLVEGFTGANAGREELGKKLKSFCGTGGSVKDGEIIVQGDHRDKVLQWLLKNGYRSAKKK